MLPFPSGFSYGSIGQLSPNNGVDPFFANVSLLLKAYPIPGRNNNQYVDDLDAGAIVNTVPALNPQTVQGAVPFFPQPALVAYNRDINGATARFVSGSYLDSIVSGINLGSANFTVEFFINIPSPTGFMHILSSPGGFSMFCGGGNPNNIFFTVGSQLTIPGFVFTSGSLAHIALCRAGPLLYRSFVNGVFSGFVNSASVLNANFNNIRIGADQSGANSLIGRISDLRISNIARYSATFTNPSGPLSVDANTIYFESFRNFGVYDATSKNYIYTEKPSASDVYASANIDFKKLCDASVQYINKGVVRVPSSTALQLGAGAWTIEGRAYLLGPFTDIFDRTLIRHFSGGLPGWRLYKSAGNVIVFTYQGATQLIGNIPMDQFFDFAITKSGSTHYMFINGTLVNQATNNVGISPTDDMFIGSDDGLSNFLGGYIEDLRITKGIARYTTSYTPSATQFPER